MSGANESAVERAHARVGMTLHNKWRLDRLLGVGGMAAVYAATHRNGARAAIKMLHLAVSLDAEARRRFLREGYLANAVGHPGAVSVLDDDTAEDGSAYLVMELLEGESLDGRAERRGGSLSPAEVIAYTDRLLEVLAAAHGKGIVHRDVKPDNVFITQDGTLKLLDFGIARLRDGGASVTMTAEGAAFGTPAFMAPEQALGRTDEIDGRTDLFSVGATMFFLLTGRCVHVARTLNEQFVAQASRPPPSLASVAPHVPAVVAAIVDRALAFERERRWPDARAMREAIHAARAKLGVAVMPGPSPAVPGVTQAAPLMGTVPPSVQAARRRGGGPSTVIVGILAGAACVIGAIVVMRLTAGPSPAPAPAASGPSPGLPTVEQAPAPPPPVASAPPPPSASAVATPVVPPVVSAAPELPPTAKGTSTPKKAPASRKPGDDSWLDRQH